MNLFDSVALDGVTRTKDGYLVAHAKVARAGVYDYLGSELDPDGSLGLRDKGIVKVYRPEEEVFHVDAMRSYAHRPVTNNHPPQMVDSKTWKNFSVGNTGGDVVRDGQFVSVPLMLADQGAIDDYDSGKKELSMGYSLKLVVADGIAPDGTPYQAKQTEMRMNHLALVNRARGGADLKIGDTQIMKTILVDSLPVEVANDQAAAIIERALATMTKNVNDANTALANATESHGKVLAAKDAELAKAHAERDAAKANVLDATALDARVVARGDLVNKAKALHAAVVTDGKSDLDIKKEIVKARGVSLDGKSDAYVEARFDALVEDAASVGTLRTAITTAVNQPVALDGAAAEQKALDKAHEDLNGWRNGKAA